MTSKPDIALLAERFKVKLDIETTPRTLLQLFPYGHERSPLMWRLAIVRDDIAFEFDGAAFAVGDAARSIGSDHGEAMWRIGYFIRRLSVSVLEALNMLDAPGGVMQTHQLQAEQYSHREGLHRGLRDLRKKLGEVDKLLKPIRNSIGGHVRPNDANPKKGADATESIEVQGLRTHWNTPGNLQINRNPPLGTSYRDFTGIALQFAWPEVTEFEHLMTKLTTFFAPLVGATHHLLVAIDAVLYAFWLDIGAVPHPNATRTDDDGTGR